MADRKAKRGAEAAELFAMMAKRYPLDTTAQILNAESLMLDSNKPTDALTALNQVSVAPGDARLSARVATLKADMYLKLGTPDAAKKTLADAIAALPAGAPQANRLKAKMDSIK
jgi:predicted Zn-dependent protease